MQIMAIYVNDVNVINVNAGISKSNSIIDPNNGINVNYVMQIITFIKIMAINLTG
jgi:hypothetical protein